MAFDIAQRFGFFKQIAQHPCQSRVFVNICQVPGVIAMLIREHSDALAAFGWLKNAHNHSHIPSRFQIQTNREMSFAARMKSLNNGCGSKGFDFSSG